MTKSEEKTHSLEKSKDAMVTLGNTFVYDISGDEISTDIPAQQAKTAPEPPPQEQPQKPKPKPKHGLKPKPLVRDTGTQYSNIVIQSLVQQTESIQSEVGPKIDVNLQEVIAGRKPSSAEKQPTAEKKVGCWDSVFKKKKPANKDEGEEYVVVDTGTQMSQTSFDSMDDDFDDMSSSDSSEEEQVRVIVGSLDLMIYRQ